MGGGGGLAPVLKDFVVVYVVTTAESSSTQVAACYADVCHMHLACNCVATHCRGISVKHRHPATVRCSSTQT